MMKRRKGFRFARSETLMLLPPREGTRVMLVPASPHGVDLIHPPPSMNCQSHRAP